MNQTLNDLTLFIQSWKSDGAFMKIWMFLDVFKCTICSILLIFIIFISRMLSFWKQIRFRGNYFFISWIWPVKHFCPAVFNFLQQRATSHQFIRDSSAEEEVLKYFTAIKVLIQQCTNTSLQVKVLQYYERCSMQYYSKSTAVL